MDRYQAAIDGYAFDCETIEDAFQKAIARYEYPYRDGADTEDMGEKARVIKLRCYWLGEDYPQHAEFLEHIKQREMFELSHPKYGLIHGRIEAVSVRHDDRLETAEVDVTFVQDLASRETPARYIDVESAGEEFFAVGQQELMDEFAGDVREALGVEAEGVLARDLNPESGIVEQFPGVSTKARNYLKNVESFVGLLAAEAAEVANPANSLLAATDFGTSLPGRVIGTLARTVERHARLRDSLTSSPLRFLRSLKGGLTGLSSRAGRFGKHTRIASGQRLALEAATLYKDDETARQTLRRREQVKSFDALGNYLDPEPAPVVMNVVELERSLAEVRDELRAGIDLARRVESLKTMALQLQEHVGTIKLERDRIVSISLDNALPLHLVCLRQGLPYAYAERLLSINELPHPSFAQGEVSVYVR